MTLRGTVHAGKRVWVAEGPLSYRCDFLVGDNSFLAGSLEETLGNGPHEWGFPEPQAGVQTAKPRAQFWQRDGPEDGEFVRCMLVCLYDCRTVVHLFSFGYDYTKWARFPAPCRKTPSSGEGRNCIVLRPVWLPRTIM